jgi:hypothetical protein
MDPWLRKLDVNRCLITQRSFKEVQLVTLIIVLLLLITLDIAALRWGFDSRELMQSRLPR